MNIRNRSRKQNRVLGILLLSVSALFAVYCLWPTSYRTETFSVESPMLPQKYELVVRYPRFGPTGTETSVEAYWRPQDSSADFNPTGQPNPVLVAEIQTADFTVSPDGQISTPLQEGKQAHFSWEVFSTSAGGGSFNLFFLKAGAQETEGVFVQQPIWARTFPYDTFPGPGGLKAALLFFAVFGGIFGLGFLLRNMLQQSRASSKTGI